MKRLALTNLMLLMAIKSVSACSVTIDPNNPNFDSVAENVFYVKTYFYSLVFLILANIVLFFLRRRKDYLVLLGIIALVLLMFPATLVASVISDCGDSLHIVLKWEFIFFLMIFCFHICLWVNKISLRINQGKLTIIKLH